MKKITSLNSTMTLLTVLRVLVGWHFLYEGIVKLINSNWTSAYYLMDSKWLFSGFFHWIVAHEPVLRIVDFMNIWGLIFIGLGLCVGLLTRIASLSGFFLLVLYYVANPPFVQTSAPVEGHYFFITKNVIEAFVLIVFASLRKDSLWGLDRYITLFTHSRKEEKFPTQDNHQVLETPANPRRELIKNLAVLPVLGGAFFGVAKKHGWISHEEGNLSAQVDSTTGASIMVGSGQNIKDLKGKVEKGKIKGLELSRIIIGGNLVSGFAHSRDLIYVSSILKKYFTDEKVIETLWLCEACGINTAILRTDDNTLRILDEYRRRGGKIQWLAQTYPKGDDMSNLQKAIDHGACGAFVQGAIADTLVRDNQLEKLDKAISFIRDNGIIAGTAAHSLTVPITCQAEGVNVDFYMKTFHSDKYWSALPKEFRGPFTVLEKSSENRDQYHDNMWCMNPEETAEFFKNNSVPWIAYKVLAAGSLHPKEAFKYIFENGVDFACVGMFDFQVVENANITHDTLASNLNRQRKWYS